MRAATTIRMARRLLRYRVVITRLAQRYRAPSRRWSMRVRSAAASARNSSRSRRASRMQARIAYGMWSRRRRSRSCSPSLVPRSRRPVRRSRTRLHACPSRKARCRPGRSTGRYSTSRCDPRRPRPKPSALASAKWTTSSVGSWRSASARRRNTARCRPPTSRRRWLTSSARKPKHVRSSRRRGHESASWSRLCSRSARASANLPRPPRRHDARPRRSRAASFRSRRCSARRWGKGRARSSTG